MAATPASMRALFRRLGYSLPSVNVLLEEGFVTVESLRDLTKEAISQMHRRLTNQHDNVLFTEVAGIHLHALSYWAKEQVRLGLVPIDPALFTEQLLFDTAERLTFEAELRLIEKDRSPMKPKALKHAVDQWDTFYNMFGTYLSQLRGVARCPLSYVIRPTADVTQEARVARYDDHDAMLIALTPHTGAHYAIDNKQVYIILKELIRDGDGWSFIRRFDNASTDGRGALESIRAHCEGDASNLAKKTKALQAIANARYTGERKRGALNDYIKLHMDNYQILTDLGETITEDRRVADFIKNMTCGVMQSAKSHIIGHPTYMRDFNEMQAYCTNYLALQASTSHPHAQRQVSAAHTSSGVDYMKMYSKKDWWALPAHSRAEIRRLREADSEFPKKSQQQKKSFKDNKRKREKATTAGGNRHAAAVATALASGDNATSDSDDSPIDTSKQYGRARKGSKKSKSDE